MIMFRYAFLMALLFAFVWTSSAYAQQSVSARTRELISQLNKTKQKKKNKGGVNVEIFVEVKFVPTPEGDIRGFSGTYADRPTLDDCRLEIDVAADGTVSGKGYDLMSIEGGRENYTLKDARVRGSLLTGTRVFADRSEPFEAVFVTASRREGTSSKDARVTQTARGIGYFGNRPQRIFLEKLK
jgi:hypothetical protein